jgi:hypothetical protein
LEQGELAINTTDEKLFTKNTAGTVVQLNADTWRGLGTTSTTACAGNDSRLSDARAPTSHTHDYLGSTATAADSQKLDGLDSTKFTREIGIGNASVGAGWITVAKSDSGRHRGEVIVSDSDSGDHAYIRIEWMRSYVDSNFTVITCGGHGNRITGARVLHETADNTYGWKLLQVYVTVSSNYRVQVFEPAAVSGWTGHTVVTPIVQDTITGYTVHGNELTGLNSYSLASEEGILAGGNIKANGTVTGSNLSGTNTGDNAGVTSVATSGAITGGTITGTGTIGHSTAAGNKHIPTGGTVGQVLKNTASGTAAWAADNNTTYSADGNYGMTLSGTAFRLENDRRRNSTAEDVWSGNTHDYTWYDANVGIRWYTAGAEDMRLTDAGDLHVDGDITAYSTTVSDERLKHDIKPIENALDKVGQLNGCTFTYNADGKESAGLIAQDVEKVLPSAVTEKELPLKIDDGNEYKVLQYDQTIGLLVEAIKELTAKVNELESR